MEKRYSIERVDLLANIISKARWVANEALPVGLEKIGMIEAWAEVLEELSTNDLKKYYLLAAKSRTSSYAVNANDIIAAWNRDRPQREAEAAERKKTHAATPPEGYSWEKDENGAWKPLQRDWKTGLFPFGKRSRMEAVQENDRWTSLQERARPARLDRVNLHLPLKPPTSDDADSYYAK